MGKPHRRRKSPFHRADCQVIALQQLGVLADITVKPGVRCGAIEVNCLPPRILTDSVDLPELHGCDDDDECTVRVFQELFIKIPIIYHAKADCDLKGIVCGPVSAVAEQQDGSRGDDDSSGHSDPTVSESEGSGSDEDCSPL